MAHNRQFLKYVVACAAGLILSNAAFAQSSENVTPPPSQIIPLPNPLGSSGQGIDPNNPLVIPPNAAPEPFDPARSQGTGNGSPDAKVEVSYDVSLLPRPVAKMRELIIEAARSGDPEKLRNLLGRGADITQLSFGDIDGDPIEYLRSVSGDAEGHEMLAILLEVMESGYVRFDAGTAQELYIWPYFYAVPLEALTPSQRVELFKLVTAGDYEDMLSFGAYIFFRVGITPEGRWRFFVAGD
ncbi:MAG: hypothetical protein U5K75_04165 [Ahrensia sp.]|nr:hypothetical protein [Ahrensia sp.]